MVKRIKRILGLTLLALFVVTMVSGQVKITINLADKAYDDFAWNEAIDLYLYAHEKDPGNVHVVRRLASSYRNKGETEEAEKWYKTLYDMDEAYPEDMFFYSMSLKSNGKYNASQDILKEYADMRPEDGRIKEQKSILEYVSFLQRDSARFIIKPVPFNTKGADWGPVYYKDKIVYVSTGDPEENRDPKYNWDNLPFLDLYSVNVDEYGNYSEPEKYAKDILTSFHDGPATFDMKSNRMYFNSNRSEKKNNKRDDANNLQIYYADWENNAWVFKGGFKYNEPGFSYSHPSIDAEGDILYFSSDRSGGKGGNDIWWCRKVNGEWGEPINMEEINTEGNEAFPFIAPDGVFYYASDGQAGMGGLDIFISVPDRGVFKTGINMGFPVNTNFDDFGIVLDDTGMKGYISSNRAGSLGYDDIYELDILWIPVIIRGTIKDRINTFELAGVRIALLDENNDTINTAVSKEDGEFVFEAFKQRNYKLIATKEDYVSAEKDVSTYNKLPNETIEVEMLMEMNFDMMEERDNLEPLSLEMSGQEELQIIQIEHINYGYDSDKILPGAAEILDKIIELVSQYQDLEIKVESHTDAKGSDEYNLKLSKLRAKSAYNYLVSKGIKAETIEYTGYGETQLLNHCEDDVECNEEEHAINRRSIIKVIRRGKYKTKRNSRSIFYF